MWQCYFAFLGDKCVGRYDALSKAEALRQARKVHGGSVEVL